MVIHETMVVLILHWMYDDDDDDDDDDDADADHDDEDPYPIATAHGWVQKCSGCTPPAWVRGCLDWKTCSWGSKFGVPFFLQATCTLW